MRIGITAVLIFALALSITGCGQPGHGTQSGQVRERSWELTRDGVVADKTAVPLPGWIRSEEPYACPPKLAIGPKGEAVVTSNVVPTLWRVDPETLAVTEHPLTLDADTDKDVGFTRLIYSPQHAAYFAVSSAHGSLWRIDTRLKRAQKIGFTFAKEDSTCAIS